MKTRDDIITDMAIPIHEGNCCTSWEQALKSAEAALDALLDSLPTGYVLEEKTCGKTLKGEDVILDSVIYDDRAEYYQQLLNMKKP